MRMKGEGEGEVWLCCGERQQGRLGIVTVAGSLNMEIPETDVRPSANSNLTRLTDDVIVIDLCRSAQE